MAESVTTSYGYRVDRADEVDSQAGLIAILVIFFTICVFALFLIITCVLWRRWKRKEQSEDAVLEWQYIRSEDIVGPLSNKDMRDLFVSMEIDRLTKVKLAWWTCDFRTIADVFTLEGTEFLVPVHTAPDEVKKDKWHSFSKHSKSSLGAPSDIDLLEWVYLDDDGQVQGPFENGKMRHWYCEGFLRDTLLVQRIDADYLTRALEDANPYPYAQICDIFPEHSTAFAAMPKVQARTQPQERTGTQDSCVSGLSYCQGHTTSNASYEHIATDGGEGFVYEEPRLGIPARVFADGNLPIEATVVGSKADQIQRNSRKKSKDAVAASASSVRVSDVTRTGSGCSARSGIEVQPGAGPEGMN